MPYEQIYRIQLANFEAQNIRLEISDTQSGDTNPPTYHDAEASSIVVRVDDSGEGKYGIKSKQVEFSFFPTVTINLNTFLEGEDDRWLVDLYVDATHKFSGYLVVDDLNEPYLDMEVITLNMTASDNLGLLRTIPYSDSTGTNPRGKFPLIDFISNSLRKTLMDLPIKAIYNLFPEQLTDTTNHTFAYVKAHTKTFEADVNVSINSYDVLNKLVTEWGCVLTQENLTGTVDWWILRVDEMNDTDYQYYTFTYDGEYVVGSTLSGYEKQIGLTETVNPINKDGELFPERKNKYELQEYPYRFPLEIVDNFDFSRGTTWYSIVTVDMGLYIKTYATLGAFPVTGEYDTVYYASGSGLYYKWTASGYVNITGAEVPQGFAYSFDDWTKKKGNPDSPTTAPMDAYVIKIRQYGDEKARYVHLTNPTTASVTRSYMESNPVPVGRYDKFTCSVDFRFPTNITTGGAPFYVIMAVRLKGEDGSNWWLGKAVISGVITEARWYSTNSTWLNNSFQPGPAIPLTFNNTRNTTEWQSCSWDAPPIPVNGELFIQLCGMNSQSNAGSTWDDTPIHYSNFQFSYNPYTNGSYQKYTGQHNKYSTPDNYRAKSESVVSLSDSPKPIFKGSLFVPSGSQDILSTLWYDYNLGTSGGIGLARLGKWQTVDYWNQHNRVIRKFQGSLLGLDTITPTDMPSLLHKYILTANTPNTNNKIFMAVSYTQNLKTCQWTVVLVEVYDSVIGKDYDDDYEFKLIT